MKKGDRSLKNGSVNDPLSLSLSPMGEGIMLFSHSLDCFSYDLPLALDAMKSIAGQIGLLQEACVA